jgi:DNA-binding transcriptional regulator YiaG
MTAKQYQAAIDKLGLSQAAAARWLGLSLRTSQHYAAGTRPVPEPTAKLLRLMLRLELKPGEVK